MDLQALLGSPETLRIEFKTDKVAASV